MGEVYSERFLVGTAGPKTYRVPDGKRAVIKCLTATNSAAAASVVEIWIGDFRVLSVPVPAGAGAERSGLQLVLYQAETLTLSCGALTTVHMSGYLLNTV